MSFDQIPAAADAAGIDESAAQTYAAIFRAFTQRGMSQPDAERYAFAAQMEAAPILLAAGRKQAADDLEFARSEAKSIYDTMKQIERERDALRATAPLDVLASIDNALRNGSYMTGANLAFNLLCDHLGVDRDALEFHPDWYALRTEGSNPT